MAYLLQGALIEYGSDFLGPLPNVVLFQFNPETLTRTIQVPPRPVGGANARDYAGGRADHREDHLARRSFSAADQLDTNDKLARVMRHRPAASPRSKRWCARRASSPGLIGAAIDAVGDALGVGGGGGDGARQPDPAREVPAHPVHLGAVPRCSPCRSTR